MANLGLVIGVAQDGTAALNTTADTLNGRIVCPSNPTAGCDFSQNNGIVRTNDNVVYSYDYSVNGGSEDITLVATAPLGTVWSVLPAFCITGSSLNSGDGLTTPSFITCRRGVQTTGTSESLPFTATVLGSAANGTVLTASGAVSGPASTTATANAPNIVVTAAPHYNLRKTYSSYSAYTLNSVAGYRIDYRAVIEVYDDSVPAAYNPRYGSESLASPITFTDNVSQISPNAVLQSCAKIADSSGSNNGNGGTISCSQTAGAGQNISVTVTSANTTLSQYVAFTPPDGRYLVGTYQIFIFIPATDVSSAPGQSLATINTLTDFDPNSPSGQSNFGTNTENTGDNVQNRNFIPLTGSFGKSYVKDFNNSNTGTVGTLVGSDRFVAPGEIFASQVSLNNNTGASLNNVVLCDVMDNSKYSVIQTPAGNGTVYANDAVAPAAVEFAAGYVNANWQPTGGGGNPAGIRAECNDSGIVWYSSATAVPGGLAAITKFRVRYNTLGNGATGTVRVRLQARDTNYYTSQTVFNGAVLPNYGIWRSDEINPNFNNNSYFPSVYGSSATGSSGARLFLARAITRVSKETADNNTINSVATGGTVGYVLKPTLSTVGTPDPVQVTVTDVLPIGLSYVVGTGQQNSVAFEPQIVNCTGSGTPNVRCTASGQQILIWTLNNQTPNLAIPPIIFTAAADLTVVNNQVVTNTAIVSSPADPSVEAQRTATRNITGASPSTLLIFKNTNTSQIEVNSAFRYTVSYRNASFTTDFSNLDFIDVLPFNGDATLPFDNGTHQRTPPSTFNGTRSLTGLSATTVSPVWYFTNANPASINISPKVAANQTPGTAGSIWCGGTAAGPAAACGYTLAQATAVRMQDTMPLLRNNSIRSLTLNFSSNGNQANDRYTNNSSGSASELALAISSNNVPIVVLESSLSGLIWFDTNGDGVRGTAETGRIADATVTLSGTTGGNVSITRITTTAANGTYAFSQLPSGTYTVQFVRPTDYTASPQNIGSDETTNSDANPQTMLTAPISLGVNDRKTNIDQGFERLNLSGTIWRDINNDGFLNNGETGISGITISLLDGNGTIVQTGTTDGNGGYLFINLTPGNYRARFNSGGFNSSSVVALDPNNDIDNDNNGIIQTGVITSNLIALAYGTEPTIDQSTGITTNSTLDFGLVVPPTSAQVTLSGRVVSPSGRGIGRVRVSLVKASGQFAYTITNPFGFFRFTNIEAGSSVIISVEAKTGTFLQSSQIVSVTEENSEIVFVTTQ